jgi:hypothetical protein
MSNPITEAAPFASATPFYVKSSLKNLLPSLIPRLKSIKKNHQTVQNYSTHVIFLI